MKVVLFGATGSVGQSITTADGAEGGAERKVRWLGEREVEVLMFNPARARH